MARRTHTYAIRLAVEGGGQVKAELVSVGQSGEQSLKRIESAGGRASGGLRDLGRQAELLRTGIRTLGGALAGVATVGGLTALVDRSISAANAIGKTADTIGAGVEALQELRFAAKASGVEQQTLDLALQRFTRRAAEAAQGTGEAKDALAQMGIALRDQSGNLRSSEDLLADVADGAVPGRHLAGQQHRGEHEHQRCVRHLPLGLGLLHQPGLQRRHRPDPVLRRLLDGPHGPPVARRSVRLPPPMERGASAHGKCAARHASLD